MRTQLERLLPSKWVATLRAVDGSICGDIPRQMQALPVDASHLVLSVGGNDALVQAGILDAAVRTVADAFRLLSDALHPFEKAYRSAIAACLSPCLPLVVCTIYNGCFPDPDFQRNVRIAIAAFDDVIIRVAVENSLRVIDLRFVCCHSSDYANPIEPSALGGAKIAAAIGRAIGADSEPLRGARLLGPD